MLRIIAGCEIELNGSAFEDGEIRWIRGLVDDGGNAAICCREKDCNRQLCSSRPGLLSPPFLLSEWERTKILGEASALTIDLQKPFFLLLVLGDFDLANGVGQAELLEGDADLLAIGRAGCVS